MATYLDRIVAAHRHAAQADERAFEPLYRAAQAAAPARGYAAALTATIGLSVIAEIKRASPSKGALAPDLDPSLLAISYEGGGAAALSVLTDADYFAGSSEDLIVARRACGLPVLRKDFTVDGRDILDARLMGADGVLLIVAALDDAELNRFVALAVEVGLDALVEVHDESEVERALAAGATLVGVNQRDLSTFAVDRDLAARLRPLLGTGVVTVAESGVEGRHDAHRLAKAGYHAVLVGEALVTSADPGAVVRSLREVPARS